MCFKVFSDNETNCFIANSSWFNVIFSVSSCFMLIQPVSSPFHQWEQSCFMLVRPVSSLFHQWERSRLMLIQSVSSLFHNCFTSGNEPLLDKVKHRFTRIIKDFNYEDWLDILSLWSLEERMNRADLLEMFKMFIGGHLRLDSIFELPTNRNTRWHTLKIFKHWSRLDLRKHFSERVVNRWNSLENGTVLCAEIKFKWLKKKRKKNGFFIDWYQWYFRSQINFSFSFYSISNIILLLVFNYVFFWK